MADPSPATFWKYLRLWIGAATRGAWDAFGFASTLSGLFLWGWHKYHAASFKTAVAFIGLSPDAAMSDLVWQVPLWFGVVALAYRFMRAPYEIHAAREQRHTDEVTALKQTIDKNSPDLVGIVEWMVLRESTQFQDQCEMLLTMNVVNAGASTIVQHWVVQLRTEEGEEITLTKSEPLPHETLTFETDVLTDIQGSDFIKYKTAPDGIPRRRNRRGFLMCHIPKDLSPRWSVVVRFNDALGKTWESNRYVPADRPNPKSFREIGGWPDLDIRHRPLST